MSRPHTLLIDSTQLDSGDALSRDFRTAAADEIERFRREIVERTGDRRQAERLSDEDLLREVVNTVGVAGRLGEQIRCVVSVSMLSEGWDARTVTHVLGVRAFGTQLLCEQIVGRALRRQSYYLNDKTGRFDVEYADVLGIPFDFTAKPVVAPPQAPRETVQVKAVTPERDACEIRFPRVQGYRVELPNDRLTAKFDDDSTLRLTPELVGPSRVLNEAVIGEGVELTLVHTNQLRRNTLLYHLTKHLLEQHWRDPNEAVHVHHGKRKGLRIKVSRARPCCSVSSVASSTDQGHVPHRTAAHGPVRQPAETQRRIPLAVELQVVEAVRDAVLENVDKHDAVPGHQLDASLNRQNVREVARPREGIRKLAVLVVKLRLRSRRGRHGVQKREPAFPAHPTRSRLG